MTRLFWIKNIVIAIILIAAFAYFSRARAQSVEPLTQSVRFATSTMSTAQQEEVVLLESKIDTLIAEQRRTNELLRAIYNK